MENVWRHLVLGLVIAVCCISSLTGDEDAETSRPEECFLPAETGTCRAWFPSWYYNSSTDTCQEFIWGGCGGNDNRFNNKESCIKTCQPEVCLLPPEVGPCRANIRMWFYSAEDRMCKEFSYGGCRGNQNRFSTQHSCELACAGSNLRCKLGSEFNVVGYKSVTIQYREKDWFLVGCERKCRSACKEDHTWGVCHAFSTRKRWHSCTCYLFDRYVTEAEFNSDTKGVTKNRLCKSDEV